MPKKEKKELTKEQILKRRERQRAYTRKKKGITEDKYRRQKEDAQILGEGDSPVDSFSLGSGFAAPIASSLEEFNKSVDVAKLEVALDKIIFKDISYGEFMEAIWASGGAITAVARKLKISVHFVAQVFQKYGYLHQMFLEFKESLLDEVEGHLMNKIRSGKNGDITAMIFFLKCHGKERGYIDRAEVRNRIPVKMKIVPAGGADAKRAEKEEKELIDLKQTRKWNLELWEQEDDNEEE